MRNERPITQYHEKINGQEVLILLAGGPPWTIEKVQVSGLPPRKDDDNTFATLEAALQEAREIAHRLA